MSRKPIIVGNWKMNKNNAETKAFFEAVDAAAAGDTATYGIGAPFTDLQTAIANAKNLIVAAENCHFEDAGAFTGEVSVPMLEELGLKYCIIGHSERRQMFGDTNETVNKKAHRLIKAGITPILCIGETEAEFDAGQSEQVIRDELAGSLKDLAPEAVANMVIAYEPIWAIGTGKSASVEIAENCCKTVRDAVRDMFGDEAADKVRIQYGGSVKPNNVVEYMAQPDIDGALIGGASLKADSFIEIIEKTK
ncbi:triose-phosphate isomerase [Catenisphaera adipataccumulans]|jgi:triosephosphate isomerase|uniref:Triosephosphate isomerase n=1 Tax=Catenisphaera adipataccumulans TaxID=700500 RepID=A0A7W8CUX2_9FIRM|nr:triose-phosphate isomerase [Catenisphaera adipataccumulans]MBB5182023.1 triosephosphate isomerase [Catenisphaera adipataccumulans]